MELNFEERTTGGKLRLLFHASIFENLSLPFQQEPPVLTIAWNTGKSQIVRVDEVPVEMPSQTIIPLVSNQTFCFMEPSTIIAWQFNREFYCIADHDVEVGCAGFLFFNNQLMTIDLDDRSSDSLRLHFKIFVEEINTSDIDQAEMLRALLKRLIINITREAKKKYAGDPLFFEDKLDIIRQFNMQVEQHFKEQHEVQFYAGQLNKSPKTLANIFLLFNNHSPLKIIHKRIILEAKRFFYYTDKPAKEIADILGFPDSATFSRFFKTHTGIAPSEFRKNLSEVQRETENSFLRR